MIDGNRLADVGFEKIGTSYSVMDCQAFVEWCIAKLGIIIDLRGSNAWFRYVMEHGWTGFYETYYQPGTVRIPASCFSDGGTFGFDIGAGVTGSPDLLVETFVLSCAPIAEGTLQPLTVQAVDSEVSYGEPGEISLGSVQAEKAIFQSLVRNTSYAYGDV